ncbi:MAG: flagellar hook-length control protein FliK [Oxalicibacterium faecigallinarum]|uniref:flagellar hook-length control protein FliK n=1 Tax=Oxalicibacterium faecigallinarum TaxID=573741 RepID=UPI0028092E00|nr:flagellar hook-length control protein FliK [Oxalicibacterium faecigallinarum]MDQ7969947.1 flagellar hook-length control protein FliK [Oxalicibacterium faecigallinarum]
MLPRADITGTRPVVLIEASVPASTIGQPRQETLERLLQLTLGKEYQAQVLARLTDGNFLVKVDTAAASMKLPPGIKTGDTLDLTLLATEPRPTFLLGKSEPGAMTSLSTAGRLIDTMLQMARQDGNNPAVMARSPLLPAATAATLPTTPQIATQIAGAMQQAVASSGLFYESHVAQWAAGNRPLSELSREPAIKRTSSVTSGMAAAITTAAPEEMPDNELQRLVSNVREWVGGERQLSDVLRHAPLRHMTTQDAIEPLMARAGQTHESTIVEHARLLNQQLDTLEQRRFLWQGELFPGQAMEWEIADDTPKGKPEEPAEQPVWNSTVRFSMPSLGAISATIRLTGDHVQLHITTADDETAQTLREHGPQLASALDAAGTKLDTLLVKKEH